MITAIARGRRWLDQIVSTSGATAETIAQRERCGPRKANMTTPLVFVPPALVKATLDGRLPQASAQPGSTMRRQNGRLSTWHLALGTWHLALDLDLDLDR